MQTLRHYRQILLVDFEFGQQDGELPEIRCMVATEFWSGRTLRLWIDDLRRMREPPFPAGDDSLFVAYFASAELNCFRVLGWPMPARILDLYVEFRRLTNGLWLPHGRGLVGALSYHGLGAIDVVEKAEMRALALRGGHYTDSERRELLAYCASDVDSLARLLPVMESKINLPSALFAGRYMAAVSAMETTGTPIDTDMLAALRENWTRIQNQLIVEIDKDYGVFVPRGQRPINKRSEYGKAILDTAAEWELEAHELRDVAEDLWKEKRDAINSEEAAVSELIGNFVSKGGRGAFTREVQQAEDCNSILRFDEMVEMAVRDFPQAIGAGYSEPEDALFHRLKEGKRPLPPRHDPDILNQAAERIADARRYGTGDEVPTGSLSFSTAKFAAWLIERGISWPHLDSGKLATDGDTFKQQARLHPEVAPLRELLHSLGQMRLFANLSVGKDGRNRCMLSPFSSSTSRNQPSNARFIFGPSVWARGLIKPAQGCGIAYLDWSGQEYGIAASLSGDRSMIADYEAGDPYLGFAKRVGSVPKDATKESHADVRAQLKIALGLGAMYGAGPQTVALQMDQPEIVAREMLQLHRLTYPTFWAWSQGAVDHAMLAGWLETVYGWRINVKPEPNPRSLANFLMQANGAEMLRLACCLATERGIRVCCPVHDAILIEGPADSMGDVVEAAKACMVEASRAVLDGFELRVDAEVVTYPDRYMDKRGEKMWATVNRIIGANACFSRATPVLQ